MKRIIFAAVIIMAALQTKAQILQPVHWSYAAKKTGPNEATVYIKATIDEGWHVYSQFVKPGGPVKTTFSFTPSKYYSLVGPVSEPKPVTRMEKVFNMEIAFFENSVIFQQKVKLKAAQATVRGKIEYMTCNDQKCLPPDEVEFSIPVK